MIKLRIPRLAAVAVLTALATQARADVYSEDFEVDPGGSVGSAVVTGGQLQLSTNTNDNNGAFHIPAIPNSSQGFIATFDVTIIDDNDPNPPADGFAFSYGAIPAGTLSAQAEEGWPTITPVISFEVDTWQNGDAEVGLNVSVNNVDLPNGFINGNILDDGTAAAPSTVEGTVTVSFYPGAGASFTTTGFVTNANFVNLPTPLSFSADDNFTFAFGARTGGANQEVLIDNLVITTGAADTDGDGLPDEYELANMLDPNDNGLDPNNNGEVGNPDNGADGDPDMDNLTNIREFMNFTNPQIDDTDDDMLLDGEEVDGLAGMRPPTNPLLADTDADGLDDLVESNSGVFVSAADPGTDPTNVDTDGDDSPDRREILKGTNPLDGDDVPPGSPAGQYVQDFDGFPVGYGGMLLFDGSDIQSTDGIAGVQADALRLTQDTFGGTRSSFRIPAIEGSSTGWTATFDLTLEDAVGNGAPADGFSFNYGAIPAFNPMNANVANADAHGQAEEGWGGIEHISFEIDTWEVGTDEVGYNIAGNVGGVQSNPDFAFMNTDVIADGESIVSPVTFSWSPESGASFLIETIGDIFTNVAIPGFVGDDSYVFAFGARTGGATQTVLIDNLVITTGSGDTRPFVIVDINYEPALGEATIAWNSIPGHFYSIDFSNDLEGTPPPAWEEIAEFIEAVSDTTTFTESGIPAGATSRYYRVRDVTQ